jgi:serine---pyruvate transaminase
VCADLKVAFRTQQTVYTLAGSGSLAMEASVVNFCSPGDEVIVLEAGKFGERWSAIAKHHQLKATLLKAEYGDVISADQVAEALKQHPKVKAVYGTLCETSTGAVSDVEGIAKYVAKTNAIFVVDAISGLLADRLEMDAWNVDVVVCGSQKGFMLPPGLGFLAVSKKAAALQKTAKCARFYIDLALYEKSIKQLDTPFTPAITLVLGLRHVLGELKKEGIEAVWARTEKLADYARDSLKGLGLEFFSKRPSNTLTAVRVPKDVDGEKLVNVMRDDKGVTMAGGQGEMKGKIFRMAHFGCVGKDEINKGISVLEQTLQELGSTAERRE